MRRRWPCKNSQALIHTWLPLTHTRDGCMWLTSTVVEDHAMTLPHHQTINTPLFLPSFNPHHHALAWGYNVIVLRLSLWKLCGCHAASWIIDRSTLFLTLSKHSPLFSTLSFKTLTKHHLPSGHSVTTYFFLWRPWTWITFSWFNDTQSQKSVHEHQNKLWHNKVFQSPFGHQFLSMV